MHTWKPARLGTAALIIGGLGALSLSTGAAWASGGTVHGVKITLEFSPNSVEAFDPFSLNPPLGPALSLTGCPFDTAATFTVTGNGELHGTSAPSGGDWGGETFNGSATLNDGELSYIGQLTLWNGGGNNHSGQAEEGETFHFHGTSTSDGSSLDVSIGYHGTLNNNGTVTNLSESVVCR